MTRPPVTTRRDVLRASAAAFAAAGTGIVTGGCGGSTPGLGLEPLTFLAALPLTTLTYTPELVADAGGFFAEEGLDVSFQSTRGTAQAIQLVLAGSAPLTRIGQIEAVRHIVTSEAPIMNVATVVKESTIRLVSNASAPLMQPRDCVGKTIGIPSEGGEAETTLDLVLASGGIDPDSVERQVVGVAPGVYNLVEQGRLAGFLVSIDTAKILEQQQPDAVVLRPGDFIDAGSQLYMLASDDLDANSDIARRYLRAIRRAIDLVLDDDGFDQTIAIMRQKYSFTTLEDDAVAKDSLAEYVRAWTAAGSANILRTDRDRWQAGYDELVRLGRVAGGADPSAWFTNALVDGQ